MFGTTLPSEFMGDILTESMYLELVASVEIQIQQPKNDLLGYDEITASCWKTHTSL